MDRPLSHIRVLDLTRVLAGPWATQNLADLGAEVIKIERPKSGDDTRSWGPPWLKGKDGSDTREAAYYLSVNRGKKSVTVDLSQPAGQRLVREPRGQERRPDRELQGRRPRPLRPRLRRRAPGQPGHRLLLGHRVRPGRPVRAAARLRLRLPGHGRADEHHRRARRPPRRRAAEGRDRGHRRADRHVREPRDHRRDRAPRADRRRPVHRHGAARHASWRSTPTRS